MTHQLDTAARARVQTAAATLIAARNGHEPLEPLPPTAAPLGEAEANAVDDLVAETSGWELRGWKIGCTSEHAQQLLGASGPFAGRVYSVFDTGVTLGPGDLLSEPHLEGEFAFTMATDLAPTDDGHTRDDVIGAIADVRPAIEIVGGRFRQFIGAPLFDLIADAGANSHLVLGVDVPLEDADSLASTAATMTVDGEETGAGTGAAVLGNPVDALAWLANHLSSRGITLRAGEVVTTGTATQVSPLPPGATSVCHIDGIGSVSLTRSA